MGFLGGAAPGGVTNTLNFMSEQAQSKADRINAERVKLGLSKIWPSQVLIYVNLFKIKFVIFRTKFDKRTKLLKLK